MVGGVDDALDDLFGEAPGLRLHLPRELLQREVAVLLAGAGDGGEVLWPDVVGRGGADIGLHFVGGCPQSF